MAARKVAKRRGLATAYSQPRRESQLQNAALPHETLATAIPGWVFPSSTLIRPPRSQPSQPLGCWLCPSASYVASVDKSLVHEKELSRAPIAFGHSSRSAIVEAGTWAPRQCPWPEGQTCAFIASRVTKPSKQDVICHRESFYPTGIPLHNDAKCRLLTVMSGGWITKSPCRITLGLQLNYIHSLVSHHSQAAMPNESIKACHLTCLLCTQPLALMPLLAG